MGEAVLRLRAGRLVAFPTETVYGLGADARNGDAVARIFTAKGRPATNPLIAHVHGISGARALTTDWTAPAEALARSFWPGPLTLVVKKRDDISALVTAGGATVGVRVPGHPVALELLARAGGMFAVAAPSANRSEEVSPTTAQHVADSLGPFCDDLLILDGGPCEIGLESTVVDVSSSPGRLLRPGMITAEQLGAALGEPVSIGAAVGDEPARSPGQMTRHYAPHTPVEIVPRNGGEIAEAPEAGMIRYTPGESARKHVIFMPQDAAAYAARLYAVLRELDTAGVPRIVIEEPPHEAGWEAIHDRLRRAAAPKSEGKTK